MDDTPHWFKSSYSDFNSGCVEVAFGGRAEVLVRDSRNSELKILGFRAFEWSRLIRVVTAELV